ncbi:MAG: 2-dehydro-3-deoxygalactonokinase [Rhizomicrobium sp.]|jgi:2-dehydro-3-deoxygalactonokinase
MAAFVAGDWGTSHLRLSLCDERGNVLQGKDGPGVGALTGDAAGTFFSLIHEWDEVHGPLPVVLCGMVGSTIGWRNVPYRACPMRPDAIASAVLRFEAGERTIAIAPGLSCRNRLIAPDVMRGEETQIFGALRCEPGLAAGAYLLCLPGTHTKWVVLNDGVIEQFLTGVTGELFDILRRHSVLVRAPETGKAIGGPAFVDALEQTKLHPDAELIHLLFGTRSRQLMGELKGTDAGAYLSGLVIGQDVAGAARLFRPELAASRYVVVIGTPRLSELYAAALKMRDIAVTKIDGANASLAGLTALHGMLFGKGLGHAA